MRLSGASSRSCWSRATAVGHAVRAMGPCAHVLALALQRRQGVAKACCWRPGWNSPDPDHYPTGGELVAHYLEPLATRTRLADAHPHRRARHRRSRARASTRSRRRAARRRPSRSATSNGKGPTRAARRRGDRCLRHLVLAQSRRRQRPRSHRRGRARRAHRLRHARRARCASGRAMPARPWPCWAPGIRPSAPSSISRASRRTEPGTQIVWLLRGDNPEKSFGGGANDKLAARGELGQQFAGIVQPGRRARRDRLPRDAMSTTSGEAAGSVAGIGVLRPPRRWPTS